MVDGILFLVIYLLSSKIHKLIRAIIVNLPVINSTDIKLKQIKVNVIAN